MNKQVWLVMAILALVYCGHENTTSVPPAEAAVQAAKAPPESRVVYAPIQAGRDRILATLPAEVQVMPGAAYELSPPLEGRIAKVGVQVGDRLETGQMIARLQIPTLQSWSEVAKNLDAQIGSAQKILAAAEEKRELGLGTAVEVETARSQLQAAQQAKLEWQRRKRSGERAGLQGQGDDWVWRAASPGVVVESHLTEGQAVQPNMPALMVVDPEQVELAVAVPERLIGYLNPETRVLWRPAGFPRDNVAPELAWRRSEGVVDKHTRTLTVYFSLPAEMPRDMRLPGRSGRGLVVAPGAEALQVPAPAVVTVEGHMGVFKRGETHLKPQWIPVEVLGENKQGILLLSDNLTLGDEIAVAGTFLLRSLKLIEPEGD